MLAYLPITTWVVMPPVFPPPPSINIIIVACYVYSFVLPSPLAPVFFIFYCAVNPTICLYLVTVSSSTPTSIITTFPFRGPLFLGPLQ